jgi:uncharacterized membrane protein YhiD involved in acid resistance
MNGFQDFQNFLALGLGPAQVLRNLGAACSCGLLVAFFYQGVTQRQAHNRAFILSLVALSLITGLVIMVIGNNLARAFGLVGAMSIIRFRTAVKDVQDVVFIFFSLAAGMAAGVGMYAAAFIGTGAVGAALLLLSRLGSLAQKRREYLLLLSYLPGAGEEAPYLPALRAHCATHQLVSMKSYEGSEEHELSFHVHLKKEEQAEELLRALRQAPGVQSVHLFFDEEYVA